MAAAYVTSGTPTTATNSAGPTIIAFDASGGNLLAVCVGYEIDGDAQTALGVTFGGVAMTEHAEKRNTLEGAAVYRLASPSASPGNIVVTLSAPSPSVWVVPVVFSGADTTTPMGTVATSPAVDGDDGTGSTTPAATSAADGIVLDMITVQSNQAASMAVVAGQTLRQMSNVGGITCGVSTEPGAASVVMDWTWLNTRRWAHIVAPIAAAGGGGGGGRTTFNARSHPLGLRLGTKRTVGGR